jgi:hypothetical protein
MDIIVLHQSGLSEMITYFSKCPEISFSAMKLKHFFSEKRISSLDTTRNMGYKHDGRAW